MVNLPWVAKYRPKSFKDYIFQDPSHKNIINQYLSSNIIPNLLLSGHRGTGKTSLVPLLQEALGVDDVDFMRINASDENNVDTIRTKIKNFISTYSTSDFKIVLLDEADYLSLNAQAILRNMMESYYENARFILTCNKPHKILPELKSRCQELTFASMDKDAMLCRLIKIVETESGNEVTDEEIEHLNAYIKTAYPDFRKIIGTVEQNFIEGKLLPPPTTGSVGGAMTDYDEIIDFMDDDQWDQIREFACKNIGDDQWEELYRFLYTNLGKCGKFREHKNKWKAGIVIIADALYRNLLVADQEINFASCAIKLSDL